MPPWEGCLHVKAGTLLLQKERYQSTCNRSGRLLAAAARSGLSARPLASVSSMEDAAAESEGPKGVWEKEEGGLGVKSFVWRGKRICQGSFLRLPGTTECPFKADDNECQVSLVCRVR